MMNPNTDNLDEKDTNRENDMEELPEGVEADTLMDMTDCTETVVIDLVDAMNKAAAIWKDVDAALRLYDPKEVDPVDNINLCVMALSTVGKKTKALEMQLASALETYIPARAKMQLVKD